MRCKKLSQLKGITYLISGFILIFAGIWCAHMERLKISETFLKKSWTTGVMFGLMLIFV